MEKLEPDRFGDKRNFAFNWKKRCTRSTRGRCDFVFFSPLSPACPALDNLIVPVPNFRGVPLRSGYATGERPLTDVYIGEVHYSVKYPILLLAQSAKDDAQDRSSTIFIRATSLRYWSPRQRSTERISRRRLLRNPFRTTGKRSKSASGGISSISETLSESVVESHVELYDFTDIRAARCNTVYHPAHLSARDPARESYCYTP